MDVAGFGFGSGFGFGFGFPGHKQRLVLAKLSGNVLFGALAAFRISHIQRI